MSPATTPHGPYEREPREPFMVVDRRKALLAQVLQGVELGAWDRRILNWLADYLDTPTFLVVLGMLQRARQAGPQPQSQAEGGGPC